MPLLSAARNDQLVLCVGAGVSVANDAGLPSGRRLSELLHERLQGRLQDYVAPENPDDLTNLLAVADAAVVPIGGLEALQIEVLQLAEFTTATPNYGHQALGALLAEGALTVLTWNWDSCIERSTPEGEMLQVAKTYEDLANLKRPMLAKVHGCATMRTTLLITSAQLAQPPLWTDQAMAQRLRDSVMVFVGIGDVADYTKRRISELIEQFHPPDIRVVSPGIQEGWDDSVWATVVPDLDPERRIAQTADEFLDDLARAWARDLLDVLGPSSEHMCESARAGVQRVREAFGQLSAVKAIRWCRAIVVRLETGSSAVRSPSSTDLLLALGVLAADADDVRMPRPACCKIDGEMIELVAPRERIFVPELVREARRRVEKLAANDQLPGDRVRFLVGGTVIGRLEDPAGAPLDVVSGDQHPADLIDGPGATDFSFVGVQSVLEQAA